MLHVIIKSNSFCVCVLRRILDYKISLYIKRVNDYISLFLSFSTDLMSHNNVFEFKCLLLFKIRGQVHHRSA